MTATARTDLRPVEALLVDMDGTLVNSDAAVERRWTAWALAHDVDPSAVIATLLENSVQAALPSM